MLTTNQPLLLQRIQHHERSKHIDTRFHFIRESVKAKEVERVHVKTSEQAADIFTKALKTEVFQYFKKMLGVQAQGGTSFKGGKCWNLNLFFNVLTE